MNTKVFIFLGAVALALADKRPTYSYNPPEVRQFSAESDEVKYDFSWEVSDENFGVDFGHEESREGDFTEGSYYVLLPDTRFQTVKYFVDGDSGFAADVHFEGEAQFPESVESKERSAPRPTFYAPRLTYAPPKSKESFEVPSYTPPRQSYRFPH